MSALAWISVDARLPSEHTEVLLVNNDGYLAHGYAIYWRPTMEFNSWVLTLMRQDVLENINAYTPTHWMPLPAAPDATP